MPVKHGDVFVLAGRGMPAKQMIVVWANFPGPIMVPDIVVVDLWQRDVQQPGDKDGDPQQTDNRTSSRPTHEHARTSRGMDDTARN